ncbi:cadmium-translocating P-type ATPase [Aquibacillus koreensis]|uniref:Cadmium-translocating P-type ATPase n=1 Tax=Aquibacillus koreensis TaxID=279446 RepID=A0A9X3WNA1_9BACI|nr:heavy metal translocating P-type ATPase [Aquibacillus koreensis]MCT2534436.1 heavy metal translocating P-type ATPase [Aquibacillus koreensis]MDC3421743.1 cadmium-translocating P-type ATPase [Aquibacillus koreensis]
MTPIHNERNHLFLNRLRKHAELIAAITSGFLIALAWGFENNLSTTTWISLNLAAFTIGGFAKAKEGIEDTIKDRKLNVEMLMIFAAIGAAAIGYWTEGAILIFIFALSGALETYTMNKSEREISSLMDLQPEQALRISNGREEFIHVSALRINDEILIKAGERIPADGVIVKGTTSIDESALTGESFPVEKEKDHKVFAGTVNLTGSLTVEITKLSSDSLFQKIITLVQNAQSEKSPSQLFIEKFENIYVNIVLVVVAVMMFLPHFIFGWSWTDTIYRAMILLVVASPCALVASIMPATLAAISTGARNGVLFKGGVHLENLTSIKAIAIDKTGTLTEGKPEVTDVYVDPNYNKETILGVTRAIEKESNHPLAKAIVSYCNEFNIDDSFDIEETKDVSGKGITAVIQGEIWRLGNLAFVGDKAQEFQNGIASQLAREAKTLVFIAKNETVVGLIALKDILRKDTIAAIKTFKNYGIQTVMLSGDNETTVRAIAKEANIDTYIANCLPEDKVTHVKQLREEYGNVAMVGDGINDAPALATANIGIAMGAGTDVALDTADVVLMKNKLSKIANAITLSARMNKIVKQNIIFSISVILVLIASNFIQVLDMPLGVIGHEGSTILVILNGLRLLKQ